MTEGGISVPIHVLLNPNQKQVVDYCQFSHGTADIQQEHCSRPG